LLRVFARRSTSLTVPGSLPPAPAPEKIFRATSPVAPTVCAARPGLFEALQSGRLSTIRESRRIEGIVPPAGFRVSLNGYRVVLHRLSGQSPISAQARSGHNIAPDGASSPDPPSPAILAGMVPIPIGAIHIFCKLPRRNGRPFYAFFSSFNRRSAPWPHRS
jgi:hypothetical protein